MKNKYLLNLFSIAAEPQPRSLFQQKKKNQKKTVVINKTKKNSNKNK